MQNFSNKTKMESLKKSFVLTQEEKETNRTNAIDIYKKLCTKKIRHNDKFQEYLKERMNNGDFRKATIGSYDTERYKDNWFGPKKERIVSKLDDDIMQNPKLQNKNLPDDFKDKKFRCETFANCLNNEMNDIGLKFECKNNWNLNIVLKVENTRKNL